jgi:hypothetical protein
MQSTHKDICEKNKIVLDFYAAIMVRNKGRFLSENAVQNWKFQLPLDFD